MERNQELFEKIELYLKGTLSAEEHEDFERAINNNPNLHREVELHKFIETETKNIDSIMFRQKLEGIYEKKKKPFRWSIAASIIILLGTFMVFMFLSKTDNTALFDKYYSIFPVEDVIRGSKKNSFEKVEKDYDDQKYEEIISELKLLITSEPENHLLKMYMGNAQLQTGQTKQALLVFQQVEIESVYYENAQWYIALCYLKLDMFDQSVLTLENVVKYNGRHQKNAQSLLSELKISIP